MSGKPFLKVSSDFTDKFNATVKQFKRDAVLVGIPEADASRKAEDEPQGPINNAALLAINEFGSAAANVPARPVMAIGIRNAQAAIVEALKKGAQLAWTKGFEALSTSYGRAGTIAANSIKKAINSQEGIEPPADATLEARRARGFKGTKALIVTGQMRNAITYVVKGKGE